MKQLEKVLESLADAEHYLFASSDFEAALPRSAGGWQCCCAGLRRQAF